MFFLVLSLSEPSTATDAYRGFESPRVKPLAVAVIDDQPHLLAANTPDASVEIYEISPTDELEWVERVPVGLEPVSVTWVSGQSAFYTANSLGDSVTRVELDASGSEVAVASVRTQPVGDSPMYVAPLPSGTIAVALDTENAYQTLDATDLTPLESVTLYDRTDVADATAAISHPRRLLADGGILFALGSRDFPIQPPDQGFSLYRRVLGTGQVLDPIGDLGTTHFDMTMGPQDSLYIVSSNARSDLEHESAVSSAPFGFVESFVHRIDDPFAPDPEIYSHNLNRDYDDPTAIWVDRAEAVSQPTNVIAYRPSPSETELYITSFGTDRVVIIDDVHEAPNEWEREVLDIPTAPTNPHPVAGPRALAVYYGDQAVDDRIYVLNALDHSISVVAPATREVLETLPLQHDPVPPEIREGQRFLYDAKLSGSGFVSCASCHVDGRTDGLAWDLGAPSPGFDSNPDLLAELLDSPFLEAVLADQIADGFAVDKGRLVTQTLQGLVDFQAPLETIEYFGESPLHWRGDRENFAAFGGAFRSLMNGPTAPTDPNFVSDDDMRTFFRFMKSVAFPPNPEQPANRRLEGQLGDITDRHTGSGSSRGLKNFLLGPAFHEAGEPLTDGRACAHCHSLPQGTNDRITFVGFTLDLNDPLPLKTAKYRDLHDREKELVDLDAPVSEFTGIATGPGGIDHNGLLVSINDHVFGFGNQLDTDPDRPNTNALNQFVRQFDRGVAPIVGRVMELTGAPPAGPDVAELDLLESQVLAGNAGLAVHVGRYDGGREGYWYDPIPEPPLYRSTGALATSLTRPELLARLAPSTSDARRLTFHATPLGDARRIAHPTGNPDPIAGTPTDLELVSMVPTSPYEDIPRFRDNWDPLHPDAPFVWNVAGVPTPPSLQRLRMLQYALIEAGGFGISHLRHEASRRLRVAGQGIRDGALLRIPVPSGEPLEFALHPTGDRTPDGKPVWITEAELAPYDAMVLMVGGQDAPGMDELRADLLTTEPPVALPFDPLTFNRYTIEVVNENGATGLAVDQVFRFSPLPCDSTPPGLIAIDSDGDGIADACSGTASFQRGDCNLDGNFDIADAIRLLDQVFGGAPPSTCADACDSNDDGALDVADSIALLSSVFGVGAPPPAPHPACGTDPTMDSLGCAGSPACP